MKKISSLMLLALALFFLGCRSELVTDPETATSQSDFRKIVKLKEASLFKDYLEEIKNNPNHTYGKGQESLFSVLSDETTVSVISTNSVTSYSTVIRHPDRTSDVLVYAIDTEKKSLGFVARYTPADPTKNFLIDDFTGTVEYTTIDGMPMGTKELNKGVPLSSKSSSTNKVNCSYSINLIEVTCGDKDYNHNPSQYGQCQAGQKPYYIVEIGYSCYGGGQQPNGFPNVGLYDGGGDGSGTSSPNTTNIEDTFNYMLFENGFNELTPEEYTFIQNNQYLGGQLLSYFYNNLNDNYVELLHWSINYLKNQTNPTSSQVTRWNKIKPFITFAQQFFNSNPTTTWSQFQNWFIEEPILNNTLQNELFEDWADPSRVKPTTRFKNNALVNCIYNKAKTAANFNQYLKNFDGRFSAAHLQFDLKSLPSIHNAETEPPVGYWIKININSNNLNRPTLDIARTFMHEIIHAEMFRILLSLAPTSNGEINPLTITQMLQNSDYPGLYDYFRRYGLNNMQHEQMAAHYRGIVKNFLKQIDNSFTEAEYDALAWQGLKGTERWNQLTTAQQQSIDSTFSTWNQSASHNCP